MIFCVMYIDKAGVGRLKNNQKKMQGKGDAEERGRRRPFEKGLAKNVETETVRIVCVMSWTRPTGSDTGAHPGSYGKGKALTIGAAPRWQPLRRSAGNLLRSSENFTEEIFRR